MLATIIQPSEAIIAFITALNIVLYQPQLRHLIQLVDALLVCSDQKTLTNLYQQFLDRPDPKTAADFFRESPWTVQAVSSPRKRWMLLKFVELAQAVGLASLVWVSVDDSLGQKDRATRHLEAVDFQHNHSESTRKKQVYRNGYVYVELHLHFGPMGFLFDTRLYLRQKKVRQLNREREPEHRLPYRSKYALAREMLLELTELLPKGYQVYVLFDSWYASAKLIKFCRRQHWHVICALKTNRRLNKQRIDHQALTLKHQRYQRVTLNAADDRRKKRTYFVRTLRGHLEDVPDEVCVLISKKHPGDKRPKFFACTDLSLSVLQILSYYQQRWPVEIDNFYLKEALGLGDFRLQSWEAIQKWFAVVVLTMNYLQYQAAEAYLKTHVLVPPADVIRQHRLAHFRMMLGRIIIEALTTGKGEEVIERFLPVADWAVT